VVLELAEPRREELPAPDEAQDEEDDVSERRKETLEAFREGRVESRDRHAVE
jgi:hypothetical protein